MTLVKSAYVVFDLCEQKKIKAIYGFRVNDMHKTVRPIGPNAVN